MKKFLLPKSVQLLVKIGLPKNDEKGLPIP